MTNIPDLAPDAKAGKALVNSDLLKVDPDELRELASTLHSEASTLDAARQPVIEAHEAAPAAIAAFVAEWEPQQEKYSEAASKWEAAGNGYSSHLDHATKKLVETANALLWIADNMEEAERVNAAKMAEVDTDLGTPDTSPTSEKPQYV